MSSTRVNATYFVSELIASELIRPKADNAFTTTTIVTDMGFNVTLDVRNDCAECVVHLKSLISTIFFPETYMENDVIVAANPTTRPSRSATWKDSCSADPDGQDRLAPNVSEMFRSIAHIWLTSCDEAAPERHQKGANVVWTMMRGFSRISSPSAFSQTMIERFLKSV